MEANKKKITDIFNGSRLLKIPFFQRAYVWKEEQWERLLTDMEYITKVYTHQEKGYFLGSIILKQEMGPIQDAISDIRIIIDGQQRLTTLAIFLKVLHLLNNMDRKFRRKFCLDDENESVSILHSLSDKEDFEKVMKLTEIEELEGNSGIIRAYNYFKQNIKIERLDIDTILRNVLFVAIDLNADEDEQLIFDTINSLGVRLTTGELLKNFFFNNNEIDKYNLYWKPVFDKDETCIDFWAHKMTAGRLKKDVTETFFYAYLQIKVQDNELNLSNEEKKMYRRTEGLFNNYKILIKDYNLDTNFIIQEITNYAKLFYKNFSFDIDKECIPSTFGIKRINFIISILDVTTLLPYIMYVDKNVPSISEKNKIFGLLESYIIRRFLCDAKNNNYSDLFTENLIGQEIRTYADLKLYLTQKDPTSSVAFPTDDDVKKRIKTTKLNNKKGLGILYLLESSLNTRHALHLRTFSEYTLEHLMPKKWQSNWNVIPGFSATDREDLICTLGNMTLLPGKLNTSISNSSWSHKLTGNNNNGLSAYASGIQTLKNALLQPQWNEHNILKRGEELAELICSTWRI